jgi:hypothetical protein
MDQASILRNKGVQAFNEMLYVKALKFFEESYILQKDLETEKLIQLCKKYVEEENHPENVEKKLKENKEKELNENDPNIDEAVLINLSK